MPQWDFLDFLADEGRRHAGFHLAMRSEATDLLHEDGRVAGFRVHAPSGARAIRAALSIGADGRGSVVRERAGLPVRELGAPIDVLWLRLSKSAGDPDQSLGRAVPGRLFVMLDRGDYWQCAFVIRKGAFEDVRAAGLEAFHREIARAAPPLADRAPEIDDWEKVKLLTVRVNRLRRWWREGLLCIGDAAHAMSPIGGIGINIAIQDAVAAANLLAAPLRRGAVTGGDLERVQRRREWPARVTQAVQVFLQNQVIAHVLEKGPDDPIGVPLPVRALQRWPALRRIPGRFIGLGARPEHVAPLRTTETGAGGC
jgi:2-polyprenyl-6-methoxyphenol hydroxylase-like FAD-dependent oxidoreductase